MINIGLWHGTISGIRHCENLQNHSFWNLVLFIFQTKTDANKSFNHNLSKWKVAITPYTAKFNICRRWLVSFACTESQLQTKNGLVTGQHRGNEIYVISVFETWSGKPEPGIEKILCNIHIQSAKVVINIILFNMRPNFNMVK